MDAGLLSSFNLKRGLFYLAVPLPILAVCMFLGQGLLGLALATIAFWPFRFRCRVEPRGIRVSWLVASEHVPWKDVVAVKLEEDQRRWVIGRRPRILVIERRDKPRVTLRGRPHVLSLLAAEMER
jgi:hypothetical protein